MILITERVLLDVLDLEKDLIRIGNRQIFNKYAKINLHKDGNNDFSYILGGKLYNFNLSTEGIDSFVDKSEDNTTYVAFIKGSLFDSIDTKIRNAILNNIEQQGAVTVYLNRD